MRGITLNAVGILVAVLAVLATSLRAEAAQPAVGRASALTMQNRMIARDTLVARVEAHYQASKWADPRWDAGVRRIHRDLVLRLCNSTTGLAPSQDLRAACKEALDEGCGDPLVLAYGAIVYYEEDRARALELARRAHDLLNERGYPRWFAASNAKILLGKDNTADKEKASVYQATYSDALFDAVHEEAIPENANTDFVLASLEIFLSEPAWSSYNAPFVQKVIPDETVDQYVRHVAVGMYNIGAGWRYRGSGMAGTVTAEGWKMFKQAMEAARNRLEKAYELRPDLPQAPTCMISIAMAGHARDGETPRFWFDRAVKARPDFFAAYTYQLNSLLPRWGGSHREMLALGLEAAATENFEGGIPSVLCHSILLVGMELGGLEALMRTPDLWPRLDAVFTGLETAASMETSRSQLYSAHACAAFLAGELVRCARISRDRDAAGYHWDPLASDAWWAEARDIRSVQLVSLAADTKTAEQALAQFGGHEWEAAAATLARLAAQESGRPEVRDACVDLQTIAEANAALRSGAAHTFQVRAAPDFGVAGLRDQWGTWSAEMPGVIKGIARGGLRTHIPCRVGHRARVSVEIDMAKAFGERKAGETLPKPGLLVGYRLMGRYTNYTSVLLDLESKNLLVGRGWKSEHVVPLKDVPVRSTIEVECWDRLLRVSVNSQEQFCGEIGTFGGQDWGLEIGLGAISESSVSLPVSFQNLKMESLRKEPDWTGRAKRLVDEDGDAVRQ